MKTLGRAAGSSRPRIGKEILVSVSLLALFFATVNGGAARSLAQLQSSAAITGDLRRRACLKPIGC